jgi:hypothetical protein
VSVLWWEEERLQQEQQLQAPTQSPLVKHLGRSPHVLDSLLLYSLQSDIVLLRLFFRSWVGGGQVQVCSHLHLMVYVTREGPQYRLRPELMEKLIRKGEVLDHAKLQLSDCAALSLSMMVATAGRLADWKQQTLELVMESECVGP